MKFLRNLLARVLGFFISLTLIFFILVAIVTSLSTEEPIVVKPNSILKLDLSTEIKDYTPKNKNPFSKIIDFVDEKLGLNNIINAIEKAKNDPDITGISIETTLINAGIAQIQAIRNKLKDFKKSGKFIYAYGDMYSQKKYYLSSVADSIFLNPVGNVDFKGLSTEILYYKDFEDKYGVKMEVVRHGKYKSAVEPFLRNSISDENKEQTTSFLQSIWSEMLNDIYKSRNISIKKLNTIADNYLGNNAKKAQENNLIDACIYQDEYQNKLMAATTKNFNTITIDDYIKSGRAQIFSSEKNTIAVIYAQGEIIYGNGNENEIGQGIIKKALEKVRTDPNIKAVVLRVNSEGGSALASELIWRELQLTKKEKPLVVSMGNFAASGGYYISSNANKIIAEPTTITGSIGVFGILPNAHQLANKIGINAEQISTNNSPYSVFEPMSKKFYEVTKKQVEYTYDTFVKRVANGRKISFQQVNKIGQGRVWTGKQALKLGLVDTLGGLQDAVKIAAKLAKIKTYKIHNYPKYPKKLKNIFYKLPFIKTSKEKIVKQMLGNTNYKIYNNIDQISKLKGIQVRMPFMFEIQ